MISEIFWSHSSYIWVFLIPFSQLNKTQGLTLLKQILIIPNRRGNPGILHLLGCAFIGKILWLFLSGYFCKKQKTKDQRKLNSVTYWTSNPMKSLHIPHWPRLSPTESCLGKSHPPFLPASLDPNLPMESTNPTDDHCTPHSLLGT
jgi:hypothetical protein